MTIEYLYKTTRADRVLQNHIKNRKLYANAVRRQHDSTVKREGSRDDRQADLRMKRLACRASHHSSI